MPTPRYRVACADDACAIAAIYAPYVRNTAISFETDAPDALEIARRIARVGARHPWLVAETEGRVVGYAYAGEHRSRSAYRWGADVTVYLDADAQRQGIGRGLYTRLLALLRAQGFINAFGGIALPNPASVALHEALGFAPIGVYRQVGYKLGAWRDVGWWQLALASPPRHPLEPIAFPDLAAGFVDELLDG